MIKLRILLLTLTIFASPAFALEILSFEPSAYPGGWHYTGSFDYENFHFDNDPANPNYQYSFALTDSEYSNTINGSYPDNGSAYVQFTRNFGEISRPDGQPFALSYFDTSEYSASRAQSMEQVFWVSGVKTDGTTISTEFLRDGLFDGAGGDADFERFYLPLEFTDLVSVRMESYNPRIGEFGAAGAFDNIGIDEPVLVASSAIRLEPDEVVPASGGSVKFERIVKNLSDEVQKAKRWEIIYLPDGTPYAYQKSNAVKLGAYAESVQASRSLSLPVWFPGGGMDYELSSLTEAQPEISLSDFYFEKTIDP